VANRLDIHYVLCTISCHAIPEVDSHQLLCHGLGPGPLSVKENKKDLYACYPPLHNLEITAQALEPKRPF